MGPRMNIAQPTITTLEQWMRTLPPRLSMDQLRAKTGFSRRTVRKCCQLCGYEIASPSKPLVAKVPRVHRIRIKTTPAPVIPKSDRILAQFRAMPPGLTRGEIAQCLGMSLSAVRRWCVRANYQPKRKPYVHRITAAVLEKTRRREAAMRQLPPGLSVAAVAKRLRINTRSAHELMAKTQYPQSTADPRVKIPPETWAQINWQKRCPDIARELGVSRSLVYLVRKRLGLPPVKRVPPVVERRQRFFAALAPGLSLKAVAKKLGLSIALARVTCRNYGYLVKMEREAYREKRRKQFENLPRGLTAGQVARRLKINHFGAIRWALAAGYRLRPGRKPWRRMQENQKQLRAQIRALPKGLPLGTVAKRLGRSETIAYRWCLEFGYAFSHSPNRQTRR